MGHIGAIIADAASVGIRNANKLAAGIPAQRFARLASPGGQTIESNHPAFVYGHLCLYPIKVQQLLGREPGEAEPPIGYDALFSKDARCVDDASGSLYPSADAILASFNRSYSTAMESLRSASDSQLTAPNPVDTPLKKLCPTLGAMLNFYMTGHVTLHCGQISAWRRMEGLPPA